MKTINQMCGMPQMNAAFAGWMKPITIQKLTQTVIEGLVVSTGELVTFQGTIQPLSPRELYLKDEGQRSFTWLQIHCFAGTLNLSPNDRIVFNDQRYKIMATKDYSLNNYIEYHAVQDYEGVL